MKITLPTTRPYDALFTVGNRSLGGNVQEIGSVIVKAGFRLVAGQGTERTMADNADAAASQMVLADQMDGADVLREADTAPYKPSSDIVVERFVSASAAEVRVDGAIWLTRTARPVTPAVDDQSRNLFGYHPRSLSPRKEEAGSPVGMHSVPDPFDPNHYTKLDHVATLPTITGYTDRVLNFHRRGPLQGFTATNAVADAVSPGRRVTIIKGAGEALSVVLSHQSLTAEIRAYCGTGPDEPPYWSRIKLGVMRADTLILNPDQGRAEVLWRSIWDWRAHPVADYRAITVTEGVI